MKGIILVDGLARAFISVTAVLSKQLVPAFRQAYA